MNQSSSEDGQKCTRCGKWVDASAQQQHEDYHLALDLQKRPQQRPAKQEDLSGHKRKPSSTSITSFFRPTK